mmetsp:Transcript_45325/g.54983  ORF Transcript_45325/g.54983 Transcript_45325/m.54983 type:complete len:336 (+) Transcript_45325:179-1186(+)|eukprot:CAMPEP_0172491204 /NCGR_PEP_ID=MMETSP1066-20121228/21931_1 /TAXON_ID=671091 /ORGANISM="Coscinodiscus wailesii, Strain CCMP2513" /LENGTH=335 /DNA_ID=CAMNT_0013260133 /DNA_START=169 /DNA_END=1176 /DNA_ORIENTATION=+
MAIQDITSLPSTPVEKKAVIFFWASWHESSSPKGHMDTVYRSLASTASISSSIDFYRVEAEAVPALSQKFSVSLVPTFIILDEKQNVIDRVDGVDPARLTQAISSLSSQTSPAGTTQPSEKSTSPLEERLKSLINANNVMLFMKGEPGHPRCGFSRQAVEILSAGKISFGTFDILSDDDVRQGLKTYSDWPTYPQIYVNGDLIGGLDILKEMNEEGDLAGQLGVEVKPEEPEITLNDRLKELLDRSRIMLFMKGLPSQPRCGFSRQIVEILEEENVPYDSFNILEDDEVRQGLKTYSDWPTYPQLYVEGDLIGGLDIVKEMKDNGDLKELLKPGS